MGTWDEVSSLATSLAGAEELEVRGLRVVEQVRERHAVVRQPALLRDHRHRRQHVAFAQLLAHGLRRYSASDDDDPIHAV